VVAEILEEGEENFPFLQFLKKGEEGMGEKGREAGEEDEAGNSRLLRKQPTDLPPVPASLLPTPTELTKIYIASKSRAANSESFREKAMQHTRDIQKPSWEDNFTKKVSLLVLLPSPSPSPPILPSSHRLPPLFLPKHSLIWHYSLLALLPLLPSVLPSLLAFIFVKVWRLVLQASRNGFDDIYKKLGVQVCLMD
jgi:hypothetical protein